MQTVAVITPMHRNALAPRANKGDDHGRDMLHRTVRCVHYWPYQRKLPTPTDYGCTWR